MFDDWDRVAGVRASPRRIFRSEREAGCQLFPSSELPYLQAARGDLNARDVDYLVAQRLYEYLNFTLHLESRVVNRALLTLSHGAAGVGLTDRMRLDACRIYTDEAYHATCTLDMIQQVTSETGHLPLPYDFVVIESLDKAACEVESLAPGLAQLLQATVFETTITSILGAIPYDAGVVGAVRGLIADHAADERRHHAYFARLFPQIWSGCDAAIRRAAGPYLAHVVATCLAPDIGHTKTMLMSAGLPADRADSVLATVFTPESVASRSRLMARHTMHLLSSHDVLEDTQTRDAFANRSLL